MNADEYTKKMKEIQESLLTFLEYENNEEENYENIIDILVQQKIKSNHHDLKIFLYMINMISNEHYRYPNFISKIEKILNYLKDKINSKYSNLEIFKIFKKNKRILLYLIEEKIITIDKNIYEEMMLPKYQKSKYPEYFSPEIKPLIEEKMQDKSKNIYSKIYEKIDELLKEDYKQFNAKRRHGENEGHLYKIIRNDLIEEFITFTQREDYSLNNYVKQSIFETNSFLLKRTKTTLIEYAVFFGSVQIFKYLYKNGVELSETLWHFAIHGENEEIIQILEENRNKAKENEEEEEDEVEDSSDSEDSETNSEYSEEYDDDFSFEKILFESIKCHHNGMANYIKENLLKDKNYKLNIVSNSFHYYNFSFFPDKMENNIVFFFACKYDYYTIVRLLLNTQKININTKFICTSLN